jgi:hypothetical protein
MIYARETDIDEVLVVAVKYCCSFREFGPALFSSLFA